MAELPKFVLSRLRGKPSESRDSSATEGFVALGLHHPDANLLAAFVEKNLTETERARVLHHLAHCAECREVAAFALPENLVTAKIQERNHSERWRGWPILRWGALAAMMGALAMVITLHPSLWQNHAGVTSSLPPAFPTGNMEGSHSTASSQVAVKSVEPVERKISLTARQSSQQAAALNQSVRPYQITSQGSLESQHAPRQQVTTLASRQPPAQIQGAPALMMGRNSVAAPTAANQTAPADSGFPALPRSVEATASPKAASAVRRWFVTSEGKVIRSAKDSDTFETIPIAAGIGFSSVAAFEDDVWAGGVGGALFHSADGGDTWTRVIVSPDGNTINETITSIQIRDSQHLTITTASGLQWESEDGGQHWHKQI